MSSSVVSVIVAIVALVGSIASASLTAYMTLYTSRRTLLEKARDVHFKYRNPILLSAWHLQSRLYNIADGFGEAYLTRRPDCVVRHTLFLVAQYFCWQTILQHDVQFLAFDRSADAVAFRDQVQLIRRTFSEHLPGDEVQRIAPLMIWTGEQNTLGELVTRKEDGQRVCMTYPEFCAEWDTDERLRRWFAPFEEDIIKLAGPDGKNFDARMRVIQRRLVDLINLLDPKHERFGQTTLVKSARGKNEQWE